MMEKVEGQSELQVVRNDEEQYSLWPAHRSLPNGWTAVGVTGSKERCLAYIAEAWIDIRPRTWRSALAGVR
jgi:MbtH protein